MLIEFTSLLIQHLCLGNNKLAIFHFGISPYSTCSLIQKCNHTLVGSLLSVEFFDFHLSVV